MHRPQSSTAVSNRSNVALLAWIILLTCLCEAAVKAILPALGTRGALDVILDPLILTCFIAPLMYSLIVRPLREAAERHRAISECAQDAIVTCDGEGHVRFWNPAAETIFGYTADEAIGKNVLDLVVPPQYHEAMQEGLAGFAHNGRGAALGKTLELTALRKDRSEFPIEMSMSAYRDRHGLVGVAVVRDVGNRKQTEQELTAYAQALESANKALEELSRAAEGANRAKSAFLANMSHEIRTPMTAILGFADLLLEGLIDSKNVEAVHTIKRNGEYLVGLINEILDLSRIEAGKLECVLVACSPWKVVAEVASLMQVRARTKNLSLEIKYDGPIPESIRTDPTRLRQILINLVGNALKFTEVGTVQLVTRLLASEGPPPRLQFEVIDTGIGMTEEEASNIFQPFTQADASTSRRFGGNGLGLSISMGLAKMLGGEITLASRPGKGSVFRLTIATGPLRGVRMLDHPAESVAQAGPRARLPASHDVKLDCRILLVEDGLDNQRLITHFLRKAGAHVTVAENGQEALEKALIGLTSPGRRHADPTGPFDLVLMDVQMPVMDGYEATRRLREGGYTGPIIALTAHAMSDDRRRCLNAGCDDFMTKPIERERLLRTVAQHANGQPPWAEATVGHETHNGEEDEVGR